MKKGQRKQVREVKMEEWEGGKEKDKVFPVLCHESQSSEQFSHEWGSTKYQNQERIRLNGDEI